jgi:hypothetical protein
MQVLLAECAYLWYRSSGRRWARTPWYVTKTVPAFSDMVAKLRRVVIAPRIWPIGAGRPTYPEIRAVQRACAAGGVDLP